MSQLEKMLKSTEELLKASARDCSLELEKDKTLVHAKMASGNILLENDEEVQIQVIVTRAKSEFLEDFEMETMEDYSRNL